MQGLGPERTRLCRDRDPIGPGTAGTGTPQDQVLKGQGLNKSRKTYAQKLHELKDLKKSHSGNVDHFEPIPPAFVPEIGEAETVSKK